MVIGLAVALVAWWLAWETCGFAGCPGVERLAAYQAGGAPVVLDRTGEELARLSPVSRALVPIEDLPAHVADAFLAVEDRRFHEHGGVDWHRAVGSALTNVRAGGIAEGFSTITMQMARNVFPERLPGERRTPRRKLLEIRVAREVEDRFTKDEILELYLNHIYFGGAVRGIEAASRQYFGKPASELDLAESATLAAMPKAPNSYNPREDPERARERRDLVLQLMADQGRIDEEQLERARSRRIRTVRERPPEEVEPPPAPYFVRVVRRVLEARLGDDLYAHPYRIHTTLDRRAQEAVERAVSRQLRLVEDGAYGPFRGRARYGLAAAVDSLGTRYLQGAAVVLDAATGDVLALMGGRDYRDSPFDRATQARRQVGSAFKPFVFAAALHDGYAPSQRLVDEPLEMELAGGEIWTPRNFDGHYQGEVSLREAAVRSNNVATVRLALAVGLDEVRSTAHDAGVRSRMPSLPSLALGTAEMTLLELTAAYVPFAAAGTAVGPRFVTLVEDTAGNPVWEADVERRKALDPGVAYLVTDLLREAVDRGTARAVRNVGFRGPAAGKTGTTNEGHDAWFIGYTPALVSGVWLGFDRPEPILERASGGELAAPLWGRMMREVARVHGIGDEWVRPDDVVSRRVDPASGLVLVDGCRPERGEPREELFLESAVPGKVCPAGEPERPGFFARIGSALESGARSVGRFVAGLFAGGDDEQQDRDRYLGRPRLPRAADLPGEMIRPGDTLPPEPLGVPVDSLPPGFGEVPVVPEPPGEEEPEKEEEVEVVPLEPVTPPGDTVESEAPPPDTGASSSRATEMQRSALAARPTTLSSPKRYA